MDAGNARSSATAISSLGTFAGALTIGDVDWYVSPADVVGPTCYTAQVSGTGASHVRLQSEVGGTTRYVTAPQSVDAPALVSVAFGGSGNLALLVQDTASAPSSYSFSIAATQPSSVEAGDALSGVDAGASLATALPISQGCVGGSLAASTLAEQVDLYALTVPANSQIAYSFAAQTTRASLILLDASGTAITSPIYSGTSGIVEVPAGGTYYLRSSTGPVNYDVGYVIGIVVGPPDPGNPCRPTC